MGIHRRVISTETQINADPHDDKDLLDLLAGHERLSAPTTLENSTGKSITTDGRPPRYSMRVIDPFIQSKVSSSSYFTSHLSSNFDLERHFQHNIF